LFCKSVPPTLPSVLTIIISPIAIRQQQQQQQGRNQRESLVLNLALFILL